MTYKVSSGTLSLRSLTQSMIGDRAFAAVAPRAWNRLLDSVHKLSTLDDSKKDLKSGLFRISLAQHDFFDVKCFRGSLYFRALYVVSLYCPGA